MKARNNLTLIACAVLAAMPTAYAAANTIYAAPGYDTINFGYRGSASSIATGPGVSIGSAAGTPLTIATETLFSGITSASTVITRPLLIDPAAANGFTLLAQAPGATQNYSATAINSVGTLIAGVTRQTATSTTNATVWGRDGTAYVLPLPTYPGYTGTGLANTTSRAINDSGTAVGAGAFYTAAGQQSSSAGYVYYNAGTGAAPSYGGGTAVQLLPLGPNAATVTNNFSTTVNGITAAGVAAGSSSQSIGNSYATYWTAGNAATTPTVAGNQLSISPITSGTYSGFSFFRTDASGLSTGSGYNSAVSAVSTGGFGVGSVVVYPAVSGTTGSFQPVRWNTLSNATPGTVLSLPSSAYTTGNAFAVNNSGDAVGTASTATTAAPVLWKSGTTTPIVMQTVNSSNVLVNPATGTSDVPAVPSFSVRGINSSGFSVGFATNSINATTPIDALVWDPDGNVTELNTLLPLVTKYGTQTQTVAGTNYTVPFYYDPADRASTDKAGWVMLVGAYGITDDGWISGVGVYYDPNAFTYTSTGNPAPMSTYGNGTYYRAFEIQLPEPASLGLLSIGGVALLRRRRPTTSRGE